MWWCRKGGRRDSGNGELLGTLGTLDDKIELNRRMSETLEAMARALFKFWFVDFDPVRAKADGRETGMVRRLAAIFPGQIAAAGGVEVPRGWTRAALGSWADCLSGGTPAKGELA